VSIPRPSNPGSDCSVDATAYLPNQDYDEKGTVRLQIQVRTR
jgi:hypothetical protein